ncbi:MAG: SurA N-terminal domain-containing protein [Candidatus Omnitrophica bacterium]|nr:SurA N-terminal domain-containing protein [Candidatus Omnitrophota bacterium]
MKRLFSSILICCFIFAGCSCGGGGGDDRVVAQVNKYKMTAEDLKYESKNRAFDEQGYLKTEKGREEYLDRLLEKEILLQEAQRQGLDREKDFMRSIENYWEQALLKLLLERKSKEISGSVHVYDNEIEEYCRASGEKTPFSRVRRDIERAIRQEKETEAMNAWIDELRDKSHIEIDTELLNEVLSD